MQSIMSTLKTKTRGSVKRTIIGIALAAIVIAIVQLNNPKFLSAANLLTVLNSIPAPAVIAFGFTLILLTGGIDLSCGYALTVCIMMMGRGVVAGYSPVVCMLLGIGTGMLIGAINGAIIISTKIPPFIVTLATMSACQGLLNLLFSGGRIMLNSDLFVTIGFGTVFSVPVALIIMLFAYVVLMFVLKRTKLGVYIYAIGSSKKNSLVSGIAVKRYTFIVYIIQGFCVGLGAVILGSRVGIVQKTSGGNGTMMDVVTAVVLGGTSTQGGEGGLTGTVIGVIALQLITSAMILFNIPVAVQDVVKGAIIVIALIVMNTLKGKNFSGNRIEK